MPCEKMHADEVDIDVDLVRDLLAEQFPQWSDLLIERVEPFGTDNASYRLGDGMGRDSLPGYKDVKPMVFAGLFPTDSDDYPELRDAQGGLPGLPDGAESEPAATRKLRACSSRLPA